MSLFKRIRFVIRASRAGRGDELDRVFAAMDDNARFIGAGGALVLCLAKERGRLDHYMNRAGRLNIHPDLLGEIYARKISRYVFDTSRDPIQEEDLPR